VRAGLQYARAVHGSALAFLLLAYLAALGVALWTGVPAQTLLTWGAGGAALLWLVLLVTLPWNLHLRAREVLAEMKRSRAAGIAVTDEQLAFVEKVKRWTLITSLGVHVLSAGVALAVAVFADQTLGYPFAGFYLLSCLVRPATAAVQQVRRRLHAIAEDTRYPRDDVMKLRNQVDRSAADIERIDEIIKEMQKQHEALATASEKQRIDLEGKITALTRKFEESLDRLTDNRELIGGIKAFLRMVREGGDPA
jgi:hypothetical protein